MEALDMPRAAAAIERIPVGYRQLRVLVADDHPDTAVTLSMLITMWGHMAWVARDGPAALEMASTNPPDVLLLDIGMPGLDGYELARKLRQNARFQDTLLVAITGWADQAHRRLGEAAGFDLYLIKPVQPSTVEVLLALEHDRLTRRSAEAVATRKTDQHSLSARQSQKRAKVASVR